MLSLPAMRSLENARLLGFVQVQVGSQVYALPVQAVRFEKDHDGHAGGFFTDEGQLGILVDGEATSGTVESQILRASAEAVQHLSRRLLN